MYRIDIPNKAAIEAQFPAIQARINEQVKRFLPNEGHEILKDVVKTKKIVLYAQVDNGSFTEWFLQQLQDEDFLKDLILGEMSQLLDIVNRVENERDRRGLSRSLVYDKMSYESYVKTFPHRVHFINPKVPEIADIFHAIVYEIFVTQGYSGYIGKGKTKKTLFDKTAHVNGLNLRICPYCGRSFIYAVDDGTKTVKPQIDHFLPKSKYPFLALSYFNLIPVCQTCNMISCKGEYDPLKTIYPQKFSLLYPYYFDDATVEFKAKFKSYDYYDDNNFEVTIDYKGDADLSTGTNKALKLDEFYKYHNREAADIYRQIMILKSRARFYYKNFDLPKSAFNPTSELVLGFRFSKENSRKELLYKLKKDTFEQFLCYYHF